MKTRNERRISAGQSNPGPVAEVLTRVDALSTVRTFPTHYIGKMLKSLTFRMCMHVYVCVCVYSTYILSRSIAIHQCANKTERLEDVRCYYGVTHRSAAGVGGGKTINSTLIYYTGPHCYWCTYKCVRLVDLFHKNNSNWTGRVPVGLSRPRTRPTTNHRRRNSHRRGTPSIFNPLLVFTSMCVVRGCGAQIQNIFNRFDR